MSITAAICYLVAKLISIVVSLKDDNLSSNSSDHRSNQSKVQADAKLGTVVVPIANVLFGLRPGSGHVGEINEADSVTAE